MRYYKILQINLNISMIDIITDNKINVTQIYNICTTFMFPKIMLNLDSMINYCLPTIKTIQSTVLY